MAVRVIQGVVNDGTQRYMKGDIITGLPQEEESRLISLGVAEPIPEVKSSNGEKADDENPYAGKTAEELIRIIESSESEEELQAIFESEMKGKHRKTVLQALEAKMENFENGQLSGDHEDKPEADKFNNFDPDELIKK